MSYYQNKMAIVKKLKTISSSGDMATQMSEAKIVKLTTLSSRTAINRHSCEMSRSCLGSDAQSNTSSDSDLSVLSDESFNHTRQLYTELYVVSDYRGDCAYGDLSVYQGEILKLVCESNSFYFVQNQSGYQGYIPIDVAVDVNEVIQRAKRKTIVQKDAKITSV